MMDPLIPLEEAKRHLRLGDYAGDDMLVEEKLEMAVAIAEDMTNRPIKLRKTEQAGVVVEDGFTSSTLPGGIKAAILMLLGTLYENEKDMITGRIVSEIPLSAKALLMPWRRHPY